MAEPRLGELQAIALDVTAARQALGWEPRTTLEDGIPETVDFIRSQLATES
jgi:UDP-glucose 4-epimerase